MADAPAKRAPSSRASTNPSSNKRASVLPAGPKPPTDLHPTATIANHAVLAGTHPIRIGPRAIVNPYARIVSGDGAVELGEGCVVWEKGTVGGGGPGDVDGDGDAADGNTGGSCVLARNVVVETGAVVRAARVGEGTVVECFARVGAGCVVGKFCKIGPYVKVPPNTTVPDYTIVYGQHSRRGDSTMRQSEVVGAIKENGHGKMVGGLGALIPSSLAKWQ